MGIRDGSSDVGSSDRPAGLGGNLAKAAVSAGLVDRMGDEAAFGARVAEVAGDAPDDKAGDFAAIDLKNYMKAHKPANGGEIGVLTIAGDIVDGEAGPGTAAGDKIGRAHV